MFIKEKDIEEYLENVDKVFYFISKNINNNTVLKALKTEIIDTGFKRLTWKII